MFFYLSKIFWILAAPVNALLILSAVTFIGLMRSHGKCLKYFRFSAYGLIITFVVIITLPVGNWSLYFWERQYMPVKEMPAKVDGIILLGAEIDPFVSDDTGLISISSNTNRVYAIPGLLRRYPNAKFVYSGGSGYARLQNYREADFAKKLLNEWGIDTKDMIFERESRNTHENVLFSKKLANPKPGETWLLVTSASHMPRAIGIFKKLDWNIIPYPVDYRAGLHMPLFCFCTGNNIEKLHTVTHEILGTFIYRLTGQAS